MRIAIPLKSQRLHGIPGALLLAPLAVLGLVLGGAQILAAQTPAAPTPAATNSAAAAHKPAHASAPLHSHAHAAKIKTKAKTQTLAPQAAVPAPVKLLGQPRPAHSGE
jgi:hypothetical protein